MIQTELRSPLAGLKRLPRHVGLIPDGNRRWAKERGLHPARGYEEGLVQGVRMLRECQDLGIEEVSVYGFTHENTHRPGDQKASFTSACVAFAAYAVKNDLPLKVIGDRNSPSFPPQLADLARDRNEGEGVKINLLVNYGWEWDLKCALATEATARRSGKLMDLLGSADVSRIDLVVRWGGCRRLSGFLPVQTVYADFYVVEEYWPDYQPEQFYEALRWYSRQDVTLGG